MRDPLYKVPVKYKLVLMFVAVCVLALGVGGFLVSSSAESSLQDEIEQRLAFQARAYATALDAYMDMLARRTEDFASDGHIRELLSKLQQGPGPAEDRSLRAEMGRHLRENKLPLVRAFCDLTVVGRREGLELAPGDTPRKGAADVAASALKRDGTWLSGLVETRGEGVPVLAAIGTPLRSLDGKQVIGALISWVHPGVWITRSLSSADLRSEREGVALSLTDDGGRVLEIARVLTQPDGPSAESEVVESGFGITLKDARDASRTRAAFSRSFAIPANGWTVHVEQETGAVHEAVARLQNRFLAVGLILALLASVLLFFPMRFLARPLVRMKDAVARIRSGDFSTRVEVSSEDEIGELAHGLNLMAEAVEERTGKLEATARDLEERQYELRRESDRLAGVISSMRDGLIVLDAGGEPVLFNKAAGVLLEAAQGNGGGGGATGHHACEAQESQGDCLQCLFDPSGPPRTCVVDLGTRVFEVHSTRLPQNERGRAGRVLVSRDISDRISQDERQIHQERLAVLGEVAAVMAHELNNPLAAITMFSQMLGTELEDKPDLEEKVEVILRNAATCKSTIRELLDYATDATPEVAGIDVHAVLEDVVRFLRPMRERAGIELAFEPQAALSEVTGDEVQIRQIFVNLVVNALQAESAGGTIRVSTRNHDDYIEVTVQDSGSGVPEDMREQIFKPFFTTKPRGDGTGLGLPTARRIAELQGGSLELDPSTGQGACFRVRLRLRCEAEV